jgi:hypothetical protein
MSYFSVDVESDGPMQHINSMVCFGAVLIEPSLSKTFYGKTRPISTTYNAESLSISGFSRQEHESFDDPKEVMIKFEEWILANSKGRPILITDNPGYDFAWINFYFHYFLGRNPFGYSARRIGDLYCGMKMDAFSKWKEILRKTSHTHNPIDDCLGNAEAVLALKEMGLKIDLK